MKTPPIAVDAAEVPPRTKRTNYPGPFAARVAGREKRSLGDLFGQQNFGVNLTRLAPNAISALRHAHTNQDEFIYVLEGRFELILDGKAAAATAGDFIRLPMQVMHGIFNKSDQPIKCLFWVSPTGKLFDLFKKIHNVADPA